MQWTTSSSICVVEALKETSLPYCVLQVGMLAAEKDRSWLAVNAGDFLSAMEDRGVTMARSVVRPLTLTSGDFGKR